jgi:hypothetical protein
MTEVTPENACTELSESLRGLNLFPWPDRRNWEVIFFDMKTVFVSSKRSSYDPIIIELLLP